MTPSALYETILRRRDVRGEFNGAPLPDDTLLRLLDAAHAAPSVGLSQPWDFIVVRDEQVRRQFHRHVTAERQRFAETLTGPLADRFASIKVEGIVEATLSLVVTYDATRGAPHVLGRLSIADAGLYSTCLAIQNLWLAATAEGIGVGWVSFFEEETVRHLLGIPAHVRPVAWLCMGPVTHFESVPDLERHQWRHRIPLAAVVHHDHW